MKSSAYLIRIVRALVIAAVAVGATASVATSAVVRPPDVQDAAVAAAAAAPDALDRYAANLTAPDALDRFVATHRGLLEGSHVPPSADVTRPPDVGDASVLARAVSVPRAGGFDWGDYGAGIGTGIGAALILAGLTAMPRIRRQGVQTA